MLRKKGFHVGKVGNTLALSIDDDGSLFQYPYTKSPHHMNALKTNKGCNKGNTVFLHDSDDGDAKHLKTLPANSSICHNPPVKCPYDQKIISRWLLSKRCMYQSLDLEKNDIELINNVLNNGTNEEVLNESIPNSTILKNDVTRCVLNQ